jgi:hypothetical protein
LITVVKSFVKEAQLSLLSCDDTDSTIPTSNVIKLFCCNRPCE